MAVNSEDILNGIIQQLDTTNEVLSGITGYIDIWVNYVQSEVNNAGDEVQEVLNEKFEEFSKKLTDKLQPIRDKIVDVLKAQFQVATQKIDELTTPISAFVEIDPIAGTITPKINPDPSELVKVITGLIDIIVGPYKPMIDFTVKFTTLIFPKVLELSNNIQTIASYQPVLTVPEDINIPSLDVVIQPITLADITGG